MPAASTGLDKPILVTGASGFVGRAVTCALLSSGYEVIPLARRSGSIGGISFKTVDLACEDSVKDLVSSIGKPLSAVIHAASVIPNRNPAEPSPGLAAGYENNVRMTDNLLKALGEHVPDYFVFLGTVDVYALPEASGTVLTELSPVFPEGNDYAQSKYDSEQRVISWAEANRVPCCIFRLTQVFGPGDNSRKFIPSVLQAARQGQPVTVYGDGRDRRDYLYVEDAARWITEALRRQPTGIFNMATGRSVSLNDVLDRLGSIHPEPLQRQYLPRKKPRLDYVFDVRNLANAIGPLNPTDFSAALAATYHAFMQQ